ncbi:hypothetical protein ACOS9E_26325, partial [Escherichia coli]
LYGDMPNNWSPELRGLGRLRFITNAFTRMLKAELFLRWDRDELPDVIDALANEMQHQGLITLQDDELHINPAHSRTLQLLAAGARETLQRYAIT